MAYTKYSLTPANNTATPPDGAPEGMLPSAVNDTMRDMMAQIRDCGDGIRDGTYTMTAAKITGGTITGVTFTGNTFSNPTVTGVSTFAAGTVSAPAITTSGDTNTGIFFPAADTIAFTEGGTEAMRIDSSGNVGIGTSSPATLLHIASSSVDPEIRLVRTPGSGNIQSIKADLNDLSFTSGRNLLYNAGGSERMRIDSSGNVLIGTTSAATSSTLNVVGAGYQPIYVNTTISGGGGAAFSRSGTQAMYIGTAGSSWLTGSSTADGLMRSEANMLFAVGNTERMRITAGGHVGIATTSILLGYGDQKFSCDGTGVFQKSGNTVLAVNRLTNDGTLVAFWQADVQEGDISVSGTTVSYNGGHLSRYAQTTAPKDDTLLKGTVLSNLDEMNEYVRPTTYWTEEDELPEGVNVGDVKEESAVVDNEQLNKVKVSDVEGDVNVAGVFVNWSHDEAHNVDEINMAMTGDMIIRIAEGVVVQKGDLLMSAGDGTAKPQGDDIVRSKTIAKVTSNHVTCTYADGSYCVPCVLMAC